MSWLIMRPLVVLWVAISLVFVGLRLLPGTALDSGESLSNSAERERRRAQLGLDQSLPQQYLDYWSDIVSGDWGTSFTSRESVPAIIRAQFAPSIALGMAAFAIALILGVGLGILGSSHGWLANLSNGLILASQSIPFYITALVAIYVFSLRLKWLPASGSENLKQLILPSIVLGFHAASSIAFVLRQNMRWVWQEAYILTARAKGLPPIDILDHAIRLAILPTLNVIALQAGFLLTGAIIIETLFLRQGLGNLLLEAILERDYPVVQALTLMMTSIYLGALALSQALEKLMDPRPA